MIFNFESFWVLGAWSPRSEISAYLTLVGQLCHQDFLYLLPQLPCLRRLPKCEGKGEPLPSPSCPGNIRNILEFFNSLCIIMSIYHTSTPVGFQNCATTGSLIKCEDLAPHRRGYRCQKDSAMRKKEKAPHCLGLLSNGDSDWFRWIQ